MGALRRVAPIPSAAPLSKPSRGAAPATCRAVARELSWTGRVVGANQKLAAPVSKYTKVIYNGVVAEMEVIPVAGGGKVPPSGRPMMKRPRVVETACCGPMAGEKKPVRRAAAADEQFSVPNPKRTKVTRDGVETSVDPAMATLRKRMAAELDALHALLRKAELMSSGKNARFTVAKQQSEAPVEPSIKTPPVKRRKVSPSGPAKFAELETPEVRNESIDITRGVSPVAILETSPVVSSEKAVETGDREIRAPLKDDDELIDICGGVSPLVSGEKAVASNNSPSSSSNSRSSSSSDSEDSDNDSGSSSSSGSDSESDSGSSSSSDSDSDIDSGEDNIPVPEAVLPVENVTSVQAAPHAALEVVQSVKLEKLSKAALIAKAKIRKQLLEMERAVLPDETIHPRELKDLCIAEYGRPDFMRLLGLFLKADA